MIIRPRRRLSIEDRIHCSLIPGIIGGGGIFVPPSDPDAASLLHFDGADTTTTFTDEAGIIWTPSGDAQLSTAQSKFGPSAMLLDGIGDWIDATDPVFAVGTGDYTAECFVRMLAITSNHFLIGFGSGWGVYALSLGGGQWAVFDGVASNVIIGGTAATNTWYHVALVRESGTITLFVAGSVIASPVSDTTNFTVGNMRLGAQTSGAGNFWGHIDEWRFSPVARYSAPFSPPVAPFINP